MILDLPYLEQVIHEVLRITLRITDLFPYTEQRGNAIRTLPTGKLKSRKKL